MCYEPAPSGYNVSTMNRDKWIVVFYLKSFYYRGEILW